MAGDTVRGLSTFMLRGGASYGVKIDAWDARRAGSPGIHESAFADPIYPEDWAA